MKSLPEFKAVDHFSGFVVEFKHAADAIKSRLVNAAILAKKFAIQLLRGASTLSTITVYWNKGKSI